LLALNIDKQQRILWVSAGEFVAECRSGPDLGAAESARVLNSFSDWLRTQSDSTNHPHSSPPENRDPATHFPVEGDCECIRRS